MHKDNRSELKLLKNLVGYAVRERPSIVPITLLGVASAVIEVGAMVSIIPLSILAGGQAVPQTSLWHKIPDALGLSADAKFYTVVFVALLLVRTLTMALSQVLNQYLMRQLIAHFSSRALDSFVRHLSFREVQKHQVGHFLALAGDEANRGAQIITGIMKLIPFVVLFLLYVLAIFVKSWEIGAGLFAFAAFAVWLLGGAFKKSHMLGQRQQEESRALNTHFVDSLSGLRTVRAFTAEQFVSTRYEQMIGGYTWTCFAIDALNAVGANAPAILLMLTLLVSTFFLVDAPWLALNMPVLLAAAVMILRLLPLANQALDTTLKLTADLKAARNVSDMLAGIKMSEKREDRAAATLDGPIRKIEFENVDFRYSADTPKVLDAFNATFEAGKSYAITGPSGSGKSSLVDLLLKFFVPDAGAIKVDGKDVASVSDIALRSRVVLAEQTIRLFYDTVLRNVQFGRDCPVEDAKAALNIVGLDALLLTLPKGIHTLLDYQGSNFSGGQRQRIGLARAILRAADVLILDESTNALDVGLRKRIIDTLLSQYRDRILIFVTHDSYITEHVDEVIHLGSARGNAPHEKVAKAVSL